LRGMVHQMPFTRYCQVPLVVSAATMAMPSAPPSESEALAFKRVATVVPALSTSFSLIGVKLVVEAVKTGAEIVAVLACTTESGESGMKNAANSRISARNTFMSMTFLTRYLFE